MRFSSIKLEHSACPGGVERPRPVSSRKTGRLTRKPRPNRFGNVEECMIVRGRPQPLGEEDPDEIGLVLDTAAAAAAALEPPLRPNAVRVRAAYCSLL